QPVGHGRREIGECAALLVAGARRIKE
ncbi:MAG: hypothetical protein JWM16_6122, partial [Verrucomicrobiales bacterium]|nr:hypothetical protein [Verrucomicrobiales bacterium]